MDKQNHLSDFKMTEQKENNFIFDRLGCCRRYIKGSHFKVYILLIICGPFRYLDNTGFKRRVVIKSGKILVADDEFLIRWSLTQALSREGYEVTSVEDGKKAIEAAKIQQFDFIITDLIMPELDGWGVLEMARQTRPQPRVIIITAQGNEEAGRLARERGAWAYVEKPYIIDKIKEILRGVFNGRFGSNLNFSSV